VQHEKCCALIRDGQIGRVECYTPSLIYLLSESSTSDSVVSDITARVCRHGCRIPSVLQSRDGRLSICRLLARGSVGHYVSPSLSCEAGAGWAGGSRTARFAMLTPEPPRLKALVHHV